MATQNKPIRIDVLLADTSLPDAVRAALRDAKSRGGGLTAHLAAIIQAADALYKAAEKVLATHEAATLAAGPSIKTTKGDVEAEAVANLGLAQRGARYAAHVALEAEHLQGRGVGVGWRAQPRSRRVLRRVACSEEEEQCHSK